MYRYLLFLLLLCFSLFYLSYGVVMAQDTTDLMSKLENEQIKNVTKYAEGTFKTTRIVDGQSVENLHRHVLDVRISHRFGPVSSGIYNFFGLDNATMRLGFDYGITDYVMVGVGHSTYQKTYDAFAKVRLLRQSTGFVEMPLTVSVVSVVAVNTLRQFDSVKTHFSDRVSSVYQILIGRKFSDQLALQLSPTLVIEDNISFDHIRKSEFAVGIGGRQRISKRINFSAEYFYQLPEMKSPNSHNVLSIGIDIGTGGHVFQLHFTNSFGITEKSFITETAGKWNKSNIMYGFNISRVFQLK